MGETDSENIPHEGLSDHRIADFDEDTNELKIVWSGAWTEAGLQFPGRMCDRNAVGHFN